MRPLENRPFSFAWNSLYGLKSENIGHSRISMYKRR